METELEEIDLGPRYIAKHVDYWTKIDDIRKQVGAELPYFTSDEEFFDTYGAKLKCFWELLCYNDDIISTLEEYENRAEQ